MDESRPQITLQDLSLNCLLENTRLLLGAPHFFDLDTVFDDICGLCSTHHQS